MSEDSDSFVAHADRVLAMARRLAASGIAVYKYEHLTLTFGSWLVVAGTRHRRMQFTWDGREILLVVSQASSGDSRQPLTWHHVRSLNLRDSEAVSEMERLLRVAFQCQGT